jgi:hypothetical protein
VHGHAVCNGRDRKKQLKFKNLGVEYLATNQGVVGSSPAGRAKQSKGCSDAGLFHTARGSTGVARERKTDAEMSASASYIGGAVGLAGVIVGAVIHVGRRMGAEHLAYWSALAAEVDLYDKGAVPTRQQGHCCARKPR